MRILGIDLGSTSVKAVELDSSFGRYEVHEYHEQPIAPGTNSAEAITLLIGSLPRKPDKIAVAMKSGQVTFRNLTLPTRDKKAIQSGVGFELEDELPFPIENAIYDYSILSQSKQGTVVHVAASLKKFLAQTLDAWNAGGVEPDQLTTEAWAYHGLFNRTQGGAAQDRPFMLVQMGHERTTLYIQWRGQPVLAREIPWGGRDLTLAICQKYGIPVDQAEKTKLDNGFVVPPAQRAEATREQLEFSDTLIAVVQQLLGDIRQAELTCKNITGETAETIYVSGGTSLLPGFARLLEEELQSSVKPFLALSSITTSGVTYSEGTDGTFLLAAALALSLVGTDRASSINFRKGEFAKSGKSRDISISALRRPLMAVGAVAACFFASLFVQSHVYKGRIVETNILLEKSVRSFFGQLSNSAVKTYMSNTSALRSAITKELNKQREISGLLSPNPKSPIGFLKDLSTAIPKDVAVDMIRFQEGAAPTSSYLDSKAAPAEASLTFLVANPQVAEKLNTLLSGKMTGLQRSKMEEVESQDETGKRWKLTFTGKPTPESMGDGNGK